VNTNEVQETIHELKRGTQVVENVNTNEVKETRYKLNTNELVFTFSRFFYPTSWYSHFPKRGKRNEVQVETRYKLLKLCEYQEDRGPQGQPNKQCVTWTKSYMQNEPKHTSVQQNKPIVEDACGAARKQGHVANQDKKRVSRDNVTILPHQARAVITHETDRRSIPEDERSRAILKQLTTRCHANWWPSPTVPTASPRPPTALHPYPPLGSTKNSASAAARRMRTL
jgi:hypothetical protein